MQNVIDLAMQSMEGEGDEERSRWSEGERSIGHLESNYHRQLISVGIDDRLIFGAVVGCVNNLSSAFAGWLG